MVREIPANKLGLKCPNPDSTQELEHNPKVKIEGGFSQNDNSIVFYVECSCDYTSEMYKVIRPDNQKETTNMSEQIYQRGGIEEFLYRSKDHFSYDYGYKRIPGPALTLNGQRLEQEFPKTIRTHP